MADAGAFGATPEVNPAAVNPAAGAPPPVAPQGYSEIETGDIAGPESDHQMPLGYSGVIDADMAPTFQAPAGFAPRGMPAALRQRLAQSDVFTSAVNGGIKAFNDSYGQAPDTVADTMRYFGVTPNRPDDMGPLGLRFLNQALLSPIAGVADSFLKAMESAPAGVGGAAGGAAKAAGSENAGAIESAAAGYAAYEMGRGDILGAPAHFYFTEGAPGAELTRVEPNPTGGYADVRVGPVPAPAEAAAQAQGVEAHFGVPGAAARVTDLYNAKGVLPAEVFHDAANEPEVLGHLAGGPVPGIYGGEPSPVAAIPNVAPEDFARLSEQAALQEQHADVTARLAALPEGDISAADRLNRLDAVETQLKDENLEPADRKALLERRDQILVDTNPEALKAAAAPIEQRRVLEAQQASIEARLGEIGAPQTTETPGGPRGEPVQPLSEGTPAPGPAAVSEVPSGEHEGVAPTASPGTPGAPGTPAGRAAPTALRPIEGTGEVKPMALAESTEEAQGKPFEEVPESQTAQDPVQRAAAAKLLQDDPERAQAIAMGQREPPKNLLRTAVYDAVLKDAMNRGDYETIRQLGTQGAMPGMAKRFGQEISFLRNIAPEDDVPSMIREVQDARMTSRGQNVAAETDQAVQQVRAAKVQAAAAKPDAWTSFINEIMCK
jgi:hypothetical protein